MTTYNANEMTVRQRNQHKSDEFASTKLVVTKSGKNHPPKKPDRFVFS